MSDIQTMLTLEQLPMVLAAEFDCNGWAGFESLVAIAAAINHARLGNEAQLLVSCTQFEKDDAFVKNALRDCKKSLKEIANACGLRTSIAMRICAPRLAIVSIKLKKPPAV